MVKLFISYSHADKEYKEQLEKHLAALRRNGEIEPWTDTMISPSEKWDESISKALNEAEIIICLISSDFINSDYCYDIEMKDALKRNDNNKAKVIPIIIRSCDWNDTPFARLQVLPTLGKPIKEWADEDQAFMDVVGGIKKSIKQLTQYTVPVQHTVIPNDPIKTEAIANAANTKFVATHTPAAYRKKNTTKIIIYAVIALIAIFVAFHFLNSSQTDANGQTDATEQVVKGGGHDANSSHQTRAATRENAIEKGEPIMKMVKEHSTQEWLIICAIGAVAGLLAGAIVNSDDNNIFLSIVIGIIGGYVGTKLFGDKLDITGNEWANQIITSTAGAVILSVVIKVIRRVLRF